MAELRKEGKKGLLFGGINFGLGVKEMERELPLSLVV